MDNRQTYKEWCRKQAELPLFMQGWWLDAAAEGKEWNALRLPSGSMLPYLLRKRLGMRFVLMPQQTQIGGYFGTADHAADIAAAIDSLHLAYYYQKYPIGQTTALELRQYGFTVKEMTTYRIADLRLRTPEDEQALVRSFSENKRRQLRKAASQVADYGLTADEFYAYHSYCLSLQGKEIAYSKTFWESLYGACQAHEAGQLIGLRDSEGRLTAAAFVAYDADTCYYLIPTYDPSLGNNGAGARLVLEAIRFAGRHSRHFDFEGSMIPSVAEHYRQFGSRPYTYYSVEKTYNPLFRLAQALYQLINRKKLS